MPRLFSSPVSQSPHQPCLTSTSPGRRYSVLDKIVPGYYQRRQEDGEICHSTCCNNTASENAMCERLAIDDIVRWAKHYKVREGEGCAEGCL